MADTTTRRELADRLESGASGAFHPQMVADLREAARLLREPVAGEVEAVKLLREMRDAAVYQTGSSAKGTSEKLRAISANMFIDALANTREFLKRHDAAILRARLDDEGKGLPKTPEGPIA